MAAVRAELVDLRQLETSAGQLAVQLARGMERRASSGLSRELREVLSNARFRSAQQGR